MVAMRRTLLAKSMSNCGELEIEQVPGSLISRSHPGTTLWPAEGYQASAFRLLAVLYSGDWSSALGFCVLAGGPIASGILGSYCSPKRPKLLVAPLSGFRIEAQGYSLALPRAPVGPTLIEACVRPVKPYLD